MIERTVFDAEHESFRDSFRRFVETEIAPYHAEWENQGRVDKAVWRKAGALGFLNMSMPSALGGSGADKLFSVVQIEELSAAGFTGIGFVLHSEIVSPYLLHYGTDARHQVHGRAASGWQFYFERQQNLYHQRLAQRFGDRGRQDQSFGWCQGNQLVFG